MKKLKNLPENNDEYWENAEKTTSVRIPLPICEGHKKDWEDFVGYIDNHDGTASCKHCGWGFNIPGYMRVYEGRVYDLRDAGSPRP
jgi:hypothetical protein